MHRTSRHPAEILTEQTADRAKDTQLHGWRDFTGTLVLADFLAGDRAAIWAAASHDDRRGLVLQGLRASGKTFDNDDVERFVLHYTEKYLGATRVAPEPPATLVQAELAGMADAQRAAVVEALRDVEAAVKAGVSTSEALAAVDMHRRELNAANKAAGYYARGWRPLLAGRDYLVEGSKRDTTYRVTGGGTCSCPAGIQGKACWHLSFVAAYMGAWDQHQLLLETRLVGRIARARSAAMAN